jgi:hypothetical protein
MRALLEDTPIRAPILASGLRYGTSQLAVAGASTTVLPPSKDLPTIMAFVPAAAANITLPPITGAVIPMEGRTIRIANQATGAFTLTINRDAADGGGSAGTVAQNVITEFIVVKGVWMTK